MHRRRSDRPWIPVLITTVVLMATAACSGGSDGATGTGSEASWEDGGIRIVTPLEGATLLDAAPENLVVLDVRTPGEFQEGHLPGAILIDFYEPDFADRLAQLDPEAPYLLYCRSGSRSSQARELMDQLGFTNVADIEGGILDWSANGLPVVR